MRYWPNSRERPAFVQKVGLLADRVSAGRGGKLPPAQCLTITPAHRVNLGGLEPSPLQSPVASRRADRVQELLSPWREPVGPAACGGVALVKLHMERIPGRGGADSIPKEGQDRESSGGADSRVAGEMARRWGWLRRATCRKPASLEQRARVRANPTCIRAAKRGKAADAGRITVSHGGRQR